MAASRSLDSWFTSARRASTSSGTASIGMHMIESDSRSVVTNNLRPDSISHSSYDVAVGRVTSCACRRDQSIPSTSAASCADVSRITPSVTGGHRNAPCSSRFQYNTRPEPSQTKIFTRSVRFERNTKTVPENGSFPSVSLTRATSPSAPLPKSTSRVATTRRRSYFGTDKEPSCSGGESSCSCRSETDSCSV